MFMEFGVIVEQGPPEELLNSPRDDRTKQFLRRFLAARNVAEIEPETARCATSGHRSPLSARSPWPLDEV